MPRKKKGPETPPDPLDPILPAVKDSLPFPIVAIGASAAGLEAFTTLRRRVLIVDDNVDSAESMKLLFARAGHDVQMVHTGKDATAAALRMRPHAVMLDIGLPDMDGYQVAREMRGHPELRDTLIVATTGYSRTQDLEKTRRAGIDEHMTKPVDFDALLERIDRVR